jgi:hypothetical protein
MYCSYLYRMHLTRLATMLQRDVKAQISSDIISYFDAVTRCYLQLGRREPPQSTQGFCLLMTFLFGHHCLQELPQS